MIKASTKVRLHTYSQLKKGLKVSHTTPKVFQNIALAALPCTFLATLPQQGARAASGTRSVNFTLCGPTAAGTTFFDLNVNTEDSVDDFRFVIQQNGMFLANRTPSGSFRTVRPYGTNYPVVVKLDYNSAINTGTFLNGAAGTLTYTGPTNVLWTQDGVGFIGVKFEISGVRHVGWIALEIIDVDDAGSKPGRKIRIYKTGWAEENSMLETPDPLSILPVELIDFTAKPTTDNIALAWRTETEQNNAGFELQRSTDGKTFTKVAFVEGKGTTLEPQSYFHNDRVLQKATTYYYRLKQIDFDGRFEYSEIVSAQLRRKTPIATFFPNPGINGKIQLNYKTSEEGLLNIQIFDVAGKELTARLQGVTAGENVLDLDFAHLDGGLFFAKLIQGKYTTYQQFVLK